MDQAVIPCLPVNLSKNRRTFKARFLGHATAFRTDPLDLYLNVRHLTSCSACQLHSSMWFGYTDMSTTYGFTNPYSRVRPNTSFDDLHICRRSGEELVLGQPVRDVTRFSDGRPPLSTALPSTYLTSTGVNKGHPIRLLERFHLGPQEDLETLPRDRDQTRYQRENLSWRVSLNIQAVVLADRVG